MITKRRIFVLKSGNPEIIKVYYFIVFVIVKIGYNFFITFLINNDSI